MPYTKVRVAASEGDRVFLEFYDPGGSVKVFGDSVIGVEDVVSYARAKMTSLNVRDSKKGGVVVGADLDLTPPTPPAPTAKQVYETDRAVVLQDYAAIQAGIYTVADPTAVANLTKAKASYAAYVAGK